MALRRHQLNKLLCYVFLAVVCFSIYSAYRQTPDKSKVDIKQGHEPDYIAIPSIPKLHNMTHKDLAVMYHRYITTVQTLCRKIVRLGKLGDGGWEVCEDREFIPTYPCLIYSVGINNDFSFDDHAADRFHCDVYSFDPSMKDAVDGKRGPRQWFYKIGLHEKTATLGNGWAVSTLKDLRRKFSHTQTKIDILKIDVEKFEWLSLTEIYEHGGLDNIRQLIIEFHIALVGEPEKIEYIQALAILKFLHDSGFRIVYSHRNLWCKFYSLLRDVDDVGCHEVTFVHIPQLKSAIG